MMKQEARTLVDKQRVLNDLGNDWVLIAKVGKDFLRTAGGILNELKAAIQEGDSKGIEYHAHRFKGIAAIFATEEITDLAQSIEDLGRNCDPSSAVPLFSCLQEKAESLNFDIEVFLQGQSAI